MISIISSWRPSAAYQRQRRSRGTIQHCGAEALQAIDIGTQPPGRTLKPSKGDLTLTKSLKEGAKLLKIEIIDHLIISEASYLSFADEGYL